MAETRNKFRRSMTMKKQINQLVLKAISKAAFETAKSSANTSCCFVVYQPKVPEAVKTLRKF